MKESMWGVYIIILGVMGILFIFFFQNITNTEEHNYTLLREAAQAAMYDAVDEQMQGELGVIKMDKEKFVENFTRRFAANAVLANTYKIEFMDINEIPPKVSMRVSTKSTTSLASNGSGETVDYNVVNTIDLIIEKKV